MSILSYSQSFKTTAKLKSDALAIPDSLIYLSETNKKGAWYYDSSDTTTAEDTGLILVNTAGNRFKRLLGPDQIVVKSWYTGSNFYFNSVSDVNATIPSTSRVRRMRVFILDTIIRQYWYRDGVLDTDLVTVSEPLTISNGPTTFSRQVLATVPSVNEIKVKSISLTGTGGVEITPTVGTDTLDFNIDASAISLFSTGTYSGRPAIGTIGQAYYQTDILEGTYRWDGNAWALGQDNNTELWCKFFGGNILPFNQSSSTSAPTDNYQSDAYYSAWEFNTGTSSTGSTQINLSANTGGNISGGGKIIYFARFAINNLSDGTDRFIVRIGRRYGTEGKGIWLRYTDNVNSGKFQLINHNGTSATTLDSGVTAVAGTFYEYVMVYDLDANNIRHYINNVQRGSTVTTNLPADFSGAYFGSASIEKTLGTNQRKFFLDEVIIKRIY